MKTFQFKNLSSTNSILHAISTRIGGVSIGDFESWNMSEKVGDSIENVNHNRLLLQNFINANQLIFPEQTHTANVKVVNQDTELQDLKETDAVITNIVGLGLGVMSADCVPILLFDPVNKAIAAIHAGWRGTVAGIVANTIALMNKEFGTNSQDVIAGIGPSISAEVYEVSDLVVDAAKAYFEDISSFVTPKENGKYWFNLWEANRQVLLKSGVKTENIEIAGICTFKNVDTYFSYRQNPNCGRFAAAIALK